MSQKESEWEVQFDKFWYYSDVGSVPEYDETKAFIRELLSTRKKEIAEEVEKLPPYYVEDNGEKMVSCSDVLKVLNNK